MIHLFLAASLFFSIQSHANIKTNLVTGNSSVELPRFYEVVKKEIYRGAQPTLEGLRRLAKLKVRTILSLRNESTQQIGNERKVAEAYGMKFVSIPLSGFFSPSESDMDRIQQILNDRSAQPVFIHCQHGQDRTGLSIGIYRVFTQNQTAETAKAEMLKYGFHEILFGLNHFFEERTGAE